MFCKKGVLKNFTKFTGLSKSKDWFLYDRDPHHERVKLKTQKFNQIFYCMIQTLVSIHGHMIKTLHLTL